MTSSGAARPEAISDDSGCGNGTPQCDPSTTQCVECLENGHCAGREPICGDDETCRQCADDDECAGASVCVTSGAEDGRCAVCDPTDDGGCTGGERCLVTGTTFECVDCLSDTDCGGTTPICNTGSHECVACADNAQ